MIIKKPHVEKQQDTIIEGAMEVDSISGKMVFMELLNELENFSKGYFGRICE